MNKTIIYFFVYFDFEVIKSSFDSLLQYKDYLDIVVVENKSINTSKIKPFFIKCLKEKKILRYYLSNKNITNNALEIVIDRELPLIKNQKYFMISDGDLLFYSKNSFIEIFNVLNTNDDVFSCGISLDMSNLPIDVFPESKNWIPQDICEHDNFIEARTGAHFLMLRTSYFLEYWSYRKKKNLRFLDSTMANYCYNNLKKWGRTKYSSARHLTWDSYADINHPYTKEKFRKNFNQTWKHYNYFSKIELFEHNIQLIFFDYKKIVNGFFCQLKSKFFL